jgi:chorismate mutase
MQVSSAIGKKKAQAHSPVFDGDREAEVLDRWIKGATARGLDTKPMEDILAIILSQSRAIQEGR